MLTFMIYLLSYKKLDSTYRDQKKINIGIINVKMQEEIYVLSVSQT